MPRRLDTQPDLVAVDLHHRHHDVPVDHDLLIDFAAQDQHQDLLDSLARRSIRFRFPRVAGNPHSPPRSEGSSGRPGSVRVRPRWDIAFPVPVNPPTGRNRPKSLWNFALFPVTALALGELWELLPGILKLFFSK